MTTKFPSDLEDQFYRDIDKLYTTYVDKGIGEEQACNCFANAMMSIMVMNLDSEEIKDTIMRMHNQVDVICADQAGRQ